MHKFFVLLSCLIFTSFAQAKKAEDSLLKVQERKAILIAEQKKTLDKIKVLEKTLTKLSQSRAAKNKTVESLQTEILEKLPLLVRFSRIHPFRLLVNPLTAPDALRGFILVRTLTTSLKSQIKQLGTELEDIKVLSQDLEKKKTAHQDLLPELQKQIARLKAMENEKIAKLKKKEKDRLAAEEDVNILLEESRIALAKLTEESRKSLASKDLPFRRLELPAKGKLINDPTLQNTYSPQSHGIIISTNKSESVVSPYGGKIVFKGPFRNQKEILIIDHGKEVHSILMGMDKIDAVVGQSVYAGQKLGKMIGYGPNNPTLYYELRQKGKTIDPEPYITQLKGSP